jgi:hypothetical protein
MLHFNARFVLRQDLVLPAKIIAQRCAPPALSDGANSAPAMPIWLGQFGDYGDTFGILIRAVLIQRLSHTCDAFQGKLREPGEFARG